MAQIFHHSANTLVRVSLVLVGGVLAFGAWSFGTLDRSAYNSRQAQMRNQPVPFSHAHHVGGMGLDCRYCHTSVETSSFAGVPPTKICMNCHSQIWSNSPTLEPVRASFRDNKSISWVRVHDLPDFVYFNHSIHVNKGVGCESCHGRVDKMALMAQESTLRMEWCLDCHRNTEKVLRPKSEITTMGYKPAGDQLEIGKQLHKEYKIQSEWLLTSCSTCHR